MVNGKWPGSTGNPMQYEQCSNPALPNMPWEVVCREGGGWTWGANPWAQTLGWCCLCLLEVQLHQRLSILLKEPAAHCAALTDLKGAAHMLRISPGAGPDFSAHYGTELLTDNLNSLACEKFVHTLGGAAGPRSWPDILAEKPMVLFMRIKISGSSVWLDQMLVPGNPALSSLGICKHLWWTSLPFPSPKQWDFEIVWY